MMSKLVAGAVPALLMAAAAAPLAVQEWTVPWEGTRPRDPYVAPTGLVWFVGQEGNYVANLDPKTGKFDRYEINPGTHPHNLVVAPDGMVWYTGNRNGRLVKLDPKTRKLTNYMMPDPDKVGDPHTMVLDKAGNAWFTAQSAAVVGRRDAKSGEIRLWETGSGTRPYGIGLDDQQRPWYVLFGTNAIGTIDPATMKDRRFELPEGARPRRIAVMKDQRIQQLGTPSEIYNRPANLFVAGFVGSPRMNFVEGRLEADGNRLIFVKDRRRLALDGYAFGGRPEAGAPVTLGVRPEHLTPVEDGADWPDFTVEIVEPMGADNLLWCAEGGLSLEVRVPGDQTIASGTRLGLSLDPQRVSLFAPESGARL